MPAAWLACAKQNLRAFDSRGLLLDSDGVAFPCGIVLEEYGTRYALTLYVCVAILAVLFVPETELALFYVLVMGYYPVLRVKLNGVKSTPLRWMLKFAVFNAGTVLVYLLLFALLGPAVLDELLADGIGMLAALLAAGNLSFWLCDRALAALTRYYHVILKPKLKKKF